MCASRLGVVSTRMVGPCQAFRHGDFPRADGRTTLEANTMRTPRRATLDGRMGYADMLSTYRVRVVALYPSDVRFMRRLRASNPPAFGCDAPEWDTSAIDWHTSEKAAGPDGGDIGQTLTIIYEVEGRNASEAAQFARAVFDWERRRAALPLPVSLAAFPDWSP